MFFAVQFTSNWSLPSVRDAMHLRIFWFLEVIFAFGEIFVNQLVSFCSSIYIGDALNSYEKCNKYADLLFQRPSLWIILFFDTLAFQETLCPVPLDHYILVFSIIRSLYFIQVYIFIPPIHSAPFLRFSHILLTPIFSYVYITMRNKFHIPDDAIDRRKLRI